MVVVLICMNNYNLIFLMYFFIVIGVVSDILGIFNFILVGDEEWSVFY